MPRDSTKRFTDRVDDYVKYRPSYPSGVVETLQRECGLSEDSVVADVGSGTGILSALLLDFGSRVIGVEPNDEMRAAAERLLSHRKRFLSVAGSAERSMLEDGSVDLVVAGQAFHWFDAEACRTEFRRILRPDGWVALIWNERLVEQSPLLRDYEALLTHWSPEYSQVDHRRVGDAQMDRFFGAGQWQRSAYPNAQRFDRDGVKGRCASSSYAPVVGTAEGDAMYAELDQLFAIHQSEGYVEFQYTTSIYWGRL